MKTYFPEGSVLSRAKNFRWNLAPLEKQYCEDKDSFLHLERLGESISKFCESNFIKELSPSERLERVLWNIYDTMKRLELTAQLFCGGSPLADHAYEAYIFTVCSSFLHTSKRVKAMPISNFVKENHPLDFVNPDSPNYREPSLLQSEVDRLRKFRQRRLSQGQVYIKQNTQWNAMTKDSEYEWARYYNLEESDDVIGGVDKRIGNLYKGIREALSAEQDDGYQNRVQEAYKKFLSKLKKIKYRDYLELYKSDLTRICKNNQYLGMNLYRLERRLQPHKIINEVKRLTECNSPELEAELLLKTVLLDEICFPKIYEDLLPNSLVLIEHYANEFLYTLTDEVAISNLILDELVEKGFWEEEWETLFLNKINEIAEEVFYDPEKMKEELNTSNFIADHVQEKFTRLLHAGVFIEMCVACNFKFYITDLLI